MARPTLPVKGNTDWEAAMKAALYDISDRADAAATAIGNLPAGTTLTVSKSSGGVWPARPTSRTDIVVQWKGAEPSPAIVSSGTGGMMDNVDIRLVTS